MISRTMRTLLFGFFGILLHSWSKLCKVRTARTGRHYDPFVVASRFQLRVYCMGVWPELEQLTRDHREYVHASSPRF